MMSVASRRAGDVNSLIELLVPATNQAKDNFRSPSYGPQEECIAASSRSRHHPQQKAAKTADLRPGQPYSADFATKLAVAFQITACQDQVILTIKRLSSYRSALFPEVLRTMDGLQLRTHTPSNGGLIAWMFDVP
jgi:hypothetical protein